MCCTRSDKMTSALTQLAGEGRSKALFLAAVREAVAGCCKLAGRDAPPSVYVTLQHVRPPGLAHCHALHSARVLLILCLCPSPPHVSLLKLVLCGICAVSIQGRAICAWEPLLTDANPEVHLT